MKPKYLNLEQLVNQNRQELLNDKNEVNEMELRFEKRLEELVSIKRKKDRLQSS